MTLTPTQLARLIADLRNLTDERCTCPACVKVREAASALTELAQDAARLAALVEAKDAHIAGLNEQIDADSKLFDALAQSTSSPSDAEKGGVTWMTIR